MTLANGDLYEFQAYDVSPVSGGSGPHRTVIVDGKPADLTKLQNRIASQYVYARCTHIPYPPGPPPVIPRTFNLFPGFRANPARDDSVIRLTLAHIRECWCRGDNELTSWVLGWFACLPQRPRTKPCSAIVVRGAPGSGKNVITDFLQENVLGAAISLNTTSMGSVLGQFTGVTEGMRLIVINEAALTGDQWAAANEKLKGFITDARGTRERKGVETEQCSDFFAFIILSNRVEPLRVDEGDRRFCCLDTAAPNRSRAYWDALHAEMNAPGAGNAFMGFLMDYDLSTWDGRVVPDTPMHRELMAGHVHPIREFVDEFFAARNDNDADIAALHPGTPTVPGCSRVMSKSEFYEAFVEWYTRKRKKGAVPSTISFGNYMHNTMGAEDVKVNRDGKRINSYKYT
jgi:hypothetical protein